MYRITSIFFILVLLSVSCQNSRRQDSEFLNASHIHIDSCNTKTVNKLAQLCKIWGFIKYYHPTVAAGKYNWDYELFRIMPLILNAQSQKENERVICNWIQSLGDIKRSKKTLAINQDSVKMYPDLAWIEDSLSLGSITKYLTTIKQAERNDWHHYVSLEPAGNAKFKNENAYSKFVIPDTGYRLLALFRYWNIIQYYFPYKYLIDEDWDHVLTRFIPLLINAKTRKEYVDVLYKLIACINDTHAILRGTLDTKKYRIPVDVSFVEGKAIVVNDTPQASQLVKGDIILKIEGESIKEIATRRFPYLSASNYATKLRELAFELLTTDKDRLYIEFERDGEYLSDFIMCSPNKKDISRYQQDKPLISYLSDRNILYLYLGAKEGEIPENINARGIIIDLRCYPSGKIKGYKDFDQLYPKSIDFVRFTVPSIKIPGLFVSTKCFAVGGENTNYYKGRKIILVNEFTQSHAEFMAMKYRCAPNTIVIGSTTAGADGNISSLPLPGGIYSCFSGIGVYYPNGSETQRVGIIPNIVIEPTIKDIKEGNDVVLNQAIKLIKNN